MAVVARSHRQVGRALHVYGCFSAISLLGNAEKEFIYVPFSQGWPFHHVATFSSYEAKCLWLELGVGLKLASASDAAIAGLWEGAQGHWRALLRRQLSKTLIVLDLLAKDLQVPAGWAA